MIFKATSNDKFRQALGYYFRETDQLPIGATASAVGRYDDVDTMSAICSWDTSGVTDMSDAFKNRRTFDQAVGGWDVSNVVNFSGTFSGALSFNQALGTWNTTSATNMEQMLQGAVKFDQYIGDWDVSGVTNFSQMFFIASSFNQDISGWEVHSGAQFQFMFAGAAVFSQNIRRWNVNAQANLISMFVLTSALQALNVDVSEFGDTPQHVFFNYEQEVEPILYGFDMPRQPTNVDRTSLALARYKLMRAPSATRSNYRYKAQNRESGSSGRISRVTSAAAHSTLSQNGIQPSFTSVDLNQIYFHLRKARN
jgi:hypothetical protein